MRLRGACALFALLIGLLSAPITLAFDSPDICSMDCCVVEGHCCCNPGHAAVKGQTPDQQDKVELAEVSAPCPEGCATPPSSSNLLFRGFVNAEGPQIPAATPAIVYSDLSFVSLKPVETGPSSPRGPPSLLNS